MPAKSTGKNGRLGSRKTRTGCGTCKIRRVKCDESRPSCLRCTNTGRQCDGYGKTIVRHPENLEPKPHRDLSPIIQANSNERRAFDFYLQRTAPVLSGALDVSFWRELIPQLSLSHPAIWDAVVAVSSLTEHPQWDNYPIEHVAGSTFGKQPPVINPDHRFALGLYSRAISRSITVSAEPGAVLVALVSCVLFICVEFLEDNMPRAITLFRAGNKLLKDYLSKGYRASTNVASVIEELIPIFTRLEVILLLTRLDVISPHLDDIIPGENPIELSYDGPVIITSLNDARNTLYDMMAPQGNFIKRASLYKLVENHELPVPADLLASQQAKINRLQEWRDSFSQLLRSKKHDNSVDAEWSSILLVHYESVMISLLTIFRPFETSYDEYTHHFENLVRHARTAIESTSRKLIATKQNSTSGRQKTFTFETGVVVPLYLVGTRCRDPRIRREALALMYQAPRKEGPHKSIPFARIVEKIIEIEEQPQDGTFNSMSSIPEERRVKHFRCFESPQPTTGDKQWYIKYTRFRQDDLGVWQIDEGVRAMEID